MFQAIGWGGNVLLSAFNYFNYFEKLSNHFLLRLLIYTIIGIAITHLMRFGLTKVKVLAKPIKSQIFYFILFSVSAAALLGCLTTLLWFEFKLTSDFQPKKIELYKFMFNASINALLDLIIWNLIYFVYHYAEKSRLQQIEQFKLKNLVKELELKTIKSHINPHFIFNALNSIRALVDENPQRARTAITELSNILRSSMQAEKMETVPLKKELDIVKDYLALEQMRFEERLKIELDIDEDTLEQQVPPMMLQTLVENAIKHGISKQMNGGFIKIISDFKSDHHELIVQNTGQLNGNGHINGVGFGVKSTQDRLNLLYQGKASFDIHNLNGNMVESKVVLPI